MADNNSKISTTQGSAIRPEYAQRSMKCFAVTESELKQIGLANLGVTIFFGLGGACFGFWINVYVDTELASQIPANAQPLIKLIQPGAIGLGVICWLVAGALWLWRWDMIKLIKRESH